MGKKGKTGKGRLDKFYHLAKEQGYRSRAAFKLIQLNKRFNFLEKAKVLIDLCAAPGGWLQIASKYMPIQSVIVGVDLVPIKPIPRCITFAEDITTDKCRAALRGALKTWKADVVLHDGAPNVGTAWVQDAYSQSELVLHSLKLATEFLNRGGWFVTKVFRSKDYNSLLWVFHQLFDTVEATKPPSSRNVSAEIFVVCQGFKAPKRIDPKFLDPRHVFKDLEEQAVTSLTSVFMPDKKRRHRDGYGDNERVLHHTLPAHEFLTAEDPVGVLSANHQITFISPEDAELKSHILSTPEILECFDDLKVLGKKDYKSLLKWRSTIRLERGLDQPKNQPSAKAENDDTEIMDDDERMANELERALREETNKAKRRKRKENERLAKQVLRLQMNMNTPSDLGTEQLGDDALFHDQVNIDTEQLGDDALFHDQVNIDTEQLGDDTLFHDQVNNVPQFSGRTALFYASNPMLQSLLSSSASAVGEVSNPEESKQPIATEDDHLAIMNADLEANAILSRKRKRKEDVLTLKDSEDESDSDLNDEESDVNMQNETNSDSDDDSFLGDVDLDTTGPPPNALTTPHALALAHMVHQNKHAMIDASFNRYAFGDDDDIPAWFKDDERKFNKPVMPISKEAVEEIEARRRALDARPIKKVAEAKFRKKKRVMAKVQRQMKRAAAIADSEDMSEAAKARAITKVMAKKITKTSEKPKVVVARGINRGIKGRPSGVKGRYKIVDPRMRKELRAQKRVEAKKSKKRRT